MHRSLLNTLVIDVPTGVRDQTVAFWAAALDAEVIPTRMENYTILGGAAPPNRVVVQDAGTEGTARIHFDIHTDDLDAEIARLEAAGATLVDTQWRDHPGSWVIMRDPAGMEFCVVWAMNEIRPQKVRDDFERRAKNVE